MQVLFYQPTFNLLIVFYRLFASNLGLAIIAVAVLSRLITYPMTRAQIKSAERGKEFQKKYDKLKKKYGKNKERLNQELAKLQAEYLPGQIGGCLPLIIMIILLIQVRAGIRNLVDQGWHAFNQVSYVESLEGDESSINYKTDQDLEIGEHTLKIEVATSGGSKVGKEYSFEIVEDVDSRLDEIKQAATEQSEEERNNEAQQVADEAKRLKEINVALYNPTIIENRYSIPLSKFLVFTTQSETAYLLTDRSPDFEIFVRPPSSETINPDQTKVFLDDNDVTTSASFAVGEPINLRFLGMDLSKAAADFSWSNAEIIPYVALAVLLGVTQYGSTRIITGLRSTKDDKKEKKAKSESKKKKSKKKEEEPDMAEMMTSMNKQMAFMFPLLTVVTSLGYWGGSNLFPAGLSVFWTVQSLFVIMQQLLMNREKILPAVKKRLNITEGEK